MANERKSLSRAIDWNVYTDFGSRHNRDDLVKLLAQHEKNHLTDILNTSDRTGLCPIHWAAIHNRSDFIEVMIENGAISSKKCHNKLFANGTPLHLAAMNGSLEVIRVLFDRSESGTSLKERDSEGQTPLMRSAPPRSKRLDTVRDLLRKNLWSLSGRPAEVALFLMIMGSDWKETDTINGMNLMHLAIMNDYDDIVNMLLVVDHEASKIPVQLKESPKVMIVSSTSSKEIKDDDMESIDLNSENKQPTNSPSVGSDDLGGSRESLIDRESRAKDLVGKTMKPLDLAIICGRVSVIDLLSDERKDSAKLKAIKRKVYWLNKRNLIRIIRGNFLRFAIAIDFVLIASIWMPIYLDNDDDSWIVTLRNGIFILSYLVTITLAFRLTSLDPGYLRKNSTRYHNRMSSLIDIKSNGKSTNKQKFETTSAVIEFVPPDDKPTNEDSNLQVDESFKAKDLSERVRLLCHKCRCIRKPRSKHCEYCNHCVRDFDHHCIYLSCCIGRLNRVDFLIMLFSLTLMALYGTIVQTNSIEYGSWNRGWHLIGFVCIFKYVFIGGLSVFFILKRACRGITMYEEIRSIRIRKIFGPRGPWKSISRSHRYFSTFKGSFWRYSPGGFFAGDSSMRSIRDNLKEFINYSSIRNYFF